MFLILESMKVFWTFCILGRCCIYRKKKQLKKIPKGMYTLYSPDYPICQSGLWCSHKECVGRINKIFLYNQNILMRESELIQVSWGGRTQTLFHDEPWVSFHLLMNENSLILWDKDVHSHCQYPSGELRTFPAHQKPSLWLIRSTWDIGFQA